jgi:Xaa-Pro dipeptidase
MIRMASKLTFGPKMTDIAEGINFSRMREERAERAKKALKKYGIPAMLVTGEPNLRYLVGFSWGEFQPWLSYTLFFAEHDPVVFAHAGCYQQMQDQAPWIKQWRIGRAWLQNICGPEATQEEAQLFAQEIRNELKERGLANEKLGIVSFDEVAREALRKEKLTVVEAWPILLEAGSIKTVDEINCIKMAATFCSVGWHKFMEVCQPGMNTAQIHHLVTNAMTEVGAEHTGGGVLSGPQSFERNVSFIPRLLESGDLAYYPLCGTSYMGYTACLYRTFKVGQRPTEKEKGWFKRLKDSLDACIEATKIGNTTADAAKAFPPASKWGYKDETEVLTVECGHGIGLVSLAPRVVNYNMPVINRQWSLKHPQPFEKGMVIAYESLEGEHRVGGVRMENIVVVTEKGAEVIDHFPREEILVAGRIY